MGGVSRHDLLKMKKKTQKTEKDSWKFTLTRWHEVPSLWRFVGSTFIINQLDTHRNEDGTYSYDIYLKPMDKYSKSNGLYPSIMDIARSLKKERLKDNKAKSKASKKKKSK